VAGLLLALTGCTAGAGPTPDDRLTSTGPEPNAAASAAVQAPETPEPEPFDLTRHSTTDPASIWVLVTKRRALRPPTYVPDLAPVEGYQVHPAVVRPLARLLRAGRRAGMDLRIMSAYRSYARQASLYAAAVAKLGAERAGLTSARAGHSEHQTGLAVDLGRARTGECNVTACFARTREARWLRGHAHRFGFVLRYPRGSTRVTGYAHESWHFRYVGRPLAAYLRREGIATLEEAFQRRS
jgi:D-alanyl-D-alanine carboxypeptidase